MLEGWVALSWKGRFTHADAIREYTSRTSTTWRSMIDRTSHRPGIGKCSFLVITISCIVLSCIVSRHGKWGPVIYAVVTVVKANAKISAWNMQHNLRVYTESTNVSYQAWPLTYIWYFVFDVLWFYFFLSVSRYTLEEPRCGIPMIFCFWVKDRIRYRYENNK